MSNCVNQFSDKAPTRKVNLDFLAGISPRNLHIAFWYIKDYCDNQIFIKRAGEVPDEYYQEVIFEIRNMAHSLENAWFRIEDKIENQFEYEDEDEDEDDINNNIEERDLIDNWLNGGEEN